MTQTRAINSANNSANNNANDNTVDSANNNTVDRVVDSANDRATDNPPTLDYTLQTIPERLAQLNQTLATNPRLNLETAANYLLHLTPEKPTSNFSAQLAPREIPTETILEPTATYVRKKAKPLWELFPEEQAGIAHLKELANRPDTPAQTAYRIRQWRLEALLDIGTISAIIRRTLPSPTTRPSPTPIQLEIDLSDSFQVKHMVVHYTQLATSENEYTKYLLRDFEELINTAPLEEWQRYLLIGRIEGRSQISLSIEIAEKFQRTLSPSYASQTMRAIYKKLADHEVFRRQNWEKRNSPNTTYAPCAKCGSELLLDDWMWSKAEQKKALKGLDALCKKCAKSK